MSAGVTVKSPVQMSTISTSSTSTTLRSEKEEKYWTQFEPGRRSQKYSSSQQISHVQSNIIPGRGALVPWWHAHLAASASSSSLKSRLPPPPIVNTRKHSNGLWHRSIACHDRKGEGDGEQYRYAGPQSERPSSSACRMGGIELQRKQSIHAGALNLPVTSFLMGDTAGQRQWQR